MRFTAINALSNNSIKYILVFNAKFVSVRSRYIASGQGRLVPISRTLFIYRSLRVSRIELTYAPRPCNFASVFYGELFVLSQLEIAFWKS